VLSEGIPVQVMRHPFREVLQAAHTPKLGWDADPERERARGLRQHEGLGPLHRQLELRWLVDATPCQQARDRGLHPAQLLLVALELEGLLLQRQQEERSAVQLGCSLQRQLLDNSVTVSKEHANCGHAPQSKSWFEKKKPLQEVGGITAQRRIRVSLEVEEVVQAAARSL